MNKFLVWYNDNSTRHFETEEEMLTQLENANTITNEFYDNGKYIGEVDYTLEEYFDNK